MAGVDLSGKKFGRLTVIERGEDFIAPKGSRQPGWICRCDCGNQITVRANGLTAGNTKSCGCLSREVHKKQNGLSRSRLYGIWRGMKKRCYNKSNEAYPEYGGRGIKVCEEWKDNFLAFYEWSMKNGYEEGLSIDRTDNDGDYEPGNCTWTTSKNQNNNRRANHFIEFNGERLTLAQWEERTGIRQETIRRRLKVGWSIEDALTKNKGER